jgi:dephospho-CoA kinase
MENETKMKKTLVINLIGGPGSGKSTTASGNNRYNGVC